MTTGTSSHSPAGPPVAAEGVSSNALVDAAGAAVLLSVPKSWVLAEARADRIPHIRLGRYVRFRPDDVLAWANGRARGPRTGSNPVSNGGASA